MSFETQSNAMAVCAIDTATDTTHNRIWTNTRAASSPNEKKHTEKEHTLRIKNGIESIDSTMKTENLCEAIDINVTSSIFFYLFISVSVAHIHLIWISTLHILTSILIGYLNSDNKFFFSFFFCFVGTSFEWRMCACVFSFCSCLCQLYFCWSNFFVAFIHSLLLHVITEIIAVVIFFFFLILFLEFFCLSCVILRILYARYIHKCSRFLFMLVFRFFWIFKETQSRTFKCWNENYLNVIWYLYFFRLLRWVCIFFCMIPFKWLVRRFIERASRRILSCSLALSTCVLYLCGRFNLSALSTIISRFYSRSLFEYISAFLLLLLLFYSLNCAHAHIPKSIRVCCLLAWICSTQN